VKMIAGVTEGWMDYAVYLDGVILPLVSEADDVEGYARCDVGVWPSETPTRTLEAEDAETGEKHRLLFATAPEWDRLRWEPYIPVGHDEPLDVIVRGKVEFRRLRP
jgi:hypothetical protein